MNQHASPLAVSYWLLGVCALIGLTVIIGGATRLTDSGLSITEWQPISGILPPFSHADWRAAFAKYQEIPEYRLVNFEMSLAEFKVIYWWEWGHRQLGRLVGIAYGAPLLWFWARGKLSPWLKPMLLLGLILGGLQGLIGWWMVRSGLSEGVDVSPIRLGIHLGLALALFTYLYGIARLLMISPTESPTGAARDGGRPAGRFGAELLILLLIFLQIFLGALVAGNDAGRAFNSWPLMDGAWIPQNLWILEPFWQNFVQNQMMVQFQHRLNAYLLFIISAAYWGFLVYRHSMSDQRARTAGIVFAVLSIQSAFGVGVLLSGAQISLALFHQAFTIIILWAAAEHILVCFVARQPARA